MKKIILLFALSLSLTSCIAQKTEPVNNIELTLKVNTLYDDQVEFQFENGRLLKGNLNTDAFTVPKGLQLEEGRKYYVSFRYLDCDNCFKRRIYIDGYSVDPEQAQRDRSTLANQFQNPLKED